MKCQKSPEFQLNSCFWDGKVKKMKRKNKKHIKKNSEEKIETIKVPMKFNNALQGFEPDLDELNKKIIEKKKEKNRKNT